MLREAKPVEIFEKRSFLTGQYALSTEVAGKADLERAIETLNLKANRPVIVLVGGADNLDGPQPALEKVAYPIAKAAEKCGAIVVTGGTTAGMMAAIGQVRKQGGFRFPLLGVAVKKLVALSSIPTRPGFLSQDTGDKLEPYHTHFLWVPGSEWGDESSWIALVATVLAGQQPSVTVLSNGGAISLHDVMKSLKIDRQVIVLEDTGRLADEFRRILQPLDILKIVSAGNEPAVFEAICHTLSTEMCNHYTL